MKNLITKDYISQIQFYQMPKAFFQNPKYMTMRIESKVAYMLLRDLLPLSITNNWVNKNQQVYVKLSRTKLMALLNIKGTQKITQVMKELVDQKLIINTKIGLTKCNEIYLYPTEDELARPQILVAKKPLESKSKKVISEQIPKTNIPMPRAKLADLEDARSEVQYLLKNQIYVDDLKQRYDPDFIDEIANNIGEMFTSTSTPIGKQDKPMCIIQDVIRKLKTHHIEHVIEQFMTVSANTEIFNPKRYIQSMIYNSVFEANTRVVGHIRHHYGYSC